ncbi:MAG: hypothetical protein Q9201_003470 [Fulgogasparrea decipioides]
MKVLAIIPVAMLALGAKLTMAAPVEESAPVTIEERDCLPNYVIYASTAGIPDSACCSGHSAGNHCVPARHLVERDCLPNNVVYASTAGIPDSACCSGHSAGNHCVPARKAVKKNAVAELTEPYGEDTVDRATPPLCVAGGNCAQPAPEPKPSPKTTAPAPAPTTSDSGVTLPAVPSDPANTPKSGNLLPPPTSDVALTPVTESPTVGGLGVSV